MWGQVLKWIPGLVINAVGPVIELVQGKDRERLRNVKKYAEQAKDGLLSNEDAIALILIEFED